MTSGKKLFFGILGAIVYVNIGTAYMLFSVGAGLTLPQFYGWLTILMWPAVLARDIIAAIVLGFAYVLHYVNIAIPYIFGGGIEYLCNTFGIVWTLFIVASVSIFIAGVAIRLWYGKREVNLPRDADEKLQSREWF